MGFMEWVRARLEANAERAQIKPTFYIKKNDSITYSPKTGKWTISEKLPEQGGWGWTRATAGGAGTSHQPGGWREESSDWYLVDRTGDVTRWEEAPTFNDREFKSWIREDPEVRYQSRDEGHWARQEPPEYQERPYQEPPGGGDDRGGYQPWPGDDSGRWR